MTVPSKIHSLLIIQKLQFDGSRKWGIGSLCPCNGHNGSARWFAWLAGRRFSISVIWTQRRTESVGTADEHYTCGTTFLRTYSARSLNTLPCRPILIQPMSPSVSAKRRLVPKTLEIIQELLSRRPRLLTSVFVQHSLPLEDVAKSRSLRIDCTFWSRP